MQYYSLIVFGFLYFSRTIIFRARKLASLEHAIFIFRYVLLDDIAFMASLACTRYFLKCCAIRIFHMLSPFQICAASDYTLAPDRPDLYIAGIRKVRDFIICNARCSIVAKYACLPYSSIKIRPSRRQLIYILLTMLRDRRAAALFIRALGFTITPPAPSFLASPLSIFTARFYLLDIVPPQSLFIYRAPNSQSITFLSR